MVPVPPPRSLSADELHALMSMARDYAVATSDGASHSQYQAISLLLRRVREAFRMDVVFVSEFVGGLRVFRHVDAQPEAQGIVREGDSDPLELSYCQRVVSGRLPRAMPDAQQVEEAREIPATQAIPVGAHLSVPIVLAGGRVFGTLCCFSRQSQPGLGEADAQALEAVANLIAAGFDKKGGLRGPLLVRDVPG
jgi:GAF domain-containing protein